MARGDGGRGWWVTGGVAAAAVLGAGAFLGWQAADRPAIARVSPEPGDAVAAADPALTVHVDRADRLGDLTVLVDGRDVSDRVRGASGTLVIPTEGLRDGVHTAEVSFRTSNLFARTVTRSWQFEVDTKPPALALKGPTSGSLSKRKAVRFTGTGEPGATVAVAWKGGAKEGVVRRNGSFALTARLPEGLVATTVSVRDRAGNTTAVEGEVVVDTIAPTIQVGQPRTGARLTQTDEPVFYGSIGRDDPAVLTYGVTVNGREAVSLPGAAGVSALPDDGLVEASATATALQIEGRSFRLSAGSLPQGLNRVVVWAKDPAGNVARTKLRVFVDSTEDFGRSDMVQGARGEDVRTLNQRLKEAKFLKGRVTDQFGPRTRAALVRYQRARSIPPTGVVNERTRHAMVGRIVVDLSDRTLRLYRDGRVVLRYRVAVGQPAYPTPTGDYEIVNMQKDPTWMPPDSPWAAGLGPIPPGPGNPLGTRWIGTSAPAVGIHGTYADSSIGTAASHGCIRMHIEDVEALYEQVEVGMPVRFKA